MATEKKQNQNQSKQQRPQDDDHFGKGYFVTVNGMIITSNPRDPLSLKEATNLFNTIKEIVLKEDSNACIGYSTIVSSKVIVEIIDSEFMEARIKEENSSFHPRQYPQYPQRMDIPVPPASIHNPNPFPTPFDNPWSQHPFMDPPAGYNPFLYGPISPINIKPEESKKEKADKQKEFFHKINEELNSTEKH